MREPELLYLEALALAEDPETDPAQLVELAQYPHDDVRDAALVHPSLPLDRFLMEVRGPWTFDALLDNPSVLFLVAENPEATWVKLLHQAKFSQWTGRIHVLASHVKSEVEMQKVLFQYAFQVLGVSWPEAMWTSTYTHPRTREVELTHHLLDQARSSYAHELKRIGNLQIPSIASGGVSYTYSFFDDLDGASYEDGKATVLERLTALLVMQNRLASLCPPKIVSPVTIPWLPDEESP